jgi:hypothetical protein
VRVVGNPPAPGVGDKKLLFDLSRVVLGPRIAPVTRFMSDRACEVSPLRFAVSIAASRCRLEK